MYEQVNAVAFPFDGGKPTARVALRGTDKLWHTFLFLVDSGADITLLPYSVGLQIGLRRRPRERMDAVHGIAGAMAVLPRTIGMRIAGRTFEAPVVWAQRETALCLGRAGVFRHFRVTIDEKRRRTVFGRS